MVVLGKRRLYSSGGLATRYSSLAILGMAKTKIKRNVNEEQLL